MKTRKVFIYNATGTWPLGVDDLSTLFTTSEKIFPDCQPDVMKCDFNFNMSGLLDPVFVVPGGSSTVQIGMKLKEQIAKIKSHYGNNFGYVGVCAGAFLGASDAELFVTSHKINDKNPDSFEPPQNFVSTKKTKLAFNVLENYQAIGSFYPNHSYLDATPQNIMPYSLPIAFNQSKRPLPLLYLHGPALFLSGDAKASGEEVVATFVEGENYKKSNSHFSALADKPLAAIVRKLPTEKSGGKLLSCVHIEACVPNSSVLKFFQYKTPQSPALKKEEYDLLVSEQKETREQVETLLRDTLKVTP